MKTLYVTDLDGTLLDREEKISEYSLNTINALVQSGMCFTYATARSLETASKVANGLAVNAPAIINNGGFIVDPQTEEILYSNFFNKAQIQKVAALLNEYGVYPLVYSKLNGAEKVSWLLGSENEGSKYYFLKRKADKRFNPLEHISKLYNGDIFYFTCMGSEQELTPAYDSLKDDPEFNCLIHKELYTDEYWFEIMPKSATKAAAALELKKLTGADRIVAFGDAINDIPLFCISDECYAVENAVTELKQAATGIIDSNYNDGVAKWLKANAMF